MPGPLPYFAPGEPAFPALTAEKLNAMVAGIRNVPGIRPRTTVSDVVSKATVECLVINTSSLDFPIFSVVRPTSAGLTVVTEQEKINFQRRPLFVVNEPAASTDFPAILLEPLKSHGGIGRAAIGGLACCKINVTDSAHKYANPIASDYTMLESGDTGQARIFHKPSGTGELECIVYLVEPTGTGGAASDFVADHVHVVGYAGSGAITCRRVSLSSPDAWPPVESGPVVEYTGVYESENREPRIVDTPGTATHIIPLYQDRDGNYYIQFWMTDTYADLEVPIAFTITEDPETCEITATPTLETYRITLSVTAPGTADTGLTLSIAAAP